MKATFVCPTYNGAGYLAETIESIRNQTVKEWELIVVDDGSTDTTKDLMQWYMTQDKRINYIRLLKNQGAVNARNMGNHAAKGDIILVIDHDDLCTKDRLAQTLSHFKKYPDTGIFHGGWVECDIFGNPLPKGLGVPVKITKELFDKGKGLLFCHSTTAYTKETAFSVPYRYVEGRTDDHVALEDWLNAGLKFRTIKRPLCFVRRLPMGQMQKIRASMGLPPSWRQ